MPAIKKCGARLSKARKARVLAYIEAHIADPISIDELAGVAALSRYHFSRAFRVSMSITPMRYVLTRRIAAAQAMLEKDPPSLTWVAYECGFMGQSHFSTAFRRIVGTTPLDYWQSLDNAPMAINSPAASS